MRLCSSQAKRQLYNTNGSGGGTWADRKRPTCLAIRPTTDVVADDKLGGRTRIFANYGHILSQGDGHTQCTPSCREITSKPKLRSRHLNAITIFDRRVPPVCEGNRWARYRQQNPVRGGHWCGKAYGRSGNLLTTCPYGAGIVLRTVQAQGNTCEPASVMTVSRLQSGSCLVATPRRICAWVLLALRTPCQSWLWKPCRSPG